MKDTNRAARIRKKATFAADIVILSVLAVIVYIEWGDWLNVAAWLVMFFVAYVGMVRELISRGWYDLSGLSCARGRIVSEDDDDESHPDNDCANPAVGFGYYGGDPNVHGMKDDD